MKSLFFTGKGGVGKSTLSSAFGYQLSEIGYKVLIVSLDPAHNLGDIFGVKLSSKEYEFAENLSLAEIDLAKASKKYLKENTKVFEEVYGYLKVLNLDRYFNILKYTPGMEENAALIEVERIFSEGEKYDYIVFDTPPTGITLRILALPSITINWLEQLIGIRKQILDKRYTIKRVRGGESDPEKLKYSESDDKVIMKLYKMLEKYQDLDSRLKGKDNAVSVVFNPDFLSMKESERLIQSLDELNIPFRLAFNNKFDSCMSEDAEKIEKHLLSGRSDVINQRVGFSGSKNNPGYVIPDALTDNYLKES